MSDLTSPWAMVRVAIVALILFAFTTRTGLQTSGMQVFTAAVLVLGALRLLYVSRDADHAPVSNGLAVSVVGLLAATTLVSTMTSDIPRLSLEAGLPYLIGIAAIAFVAFGGVSVEEAVAAIVGAALLVGYFVVSDFVSQIQDWSHTALAIDPAASLRERLPVTLPRASMPGTHPNLVAMRLEVGLVVASVLALWSSGKSRAVLMAISLVLAVALSLTGSRSGVLAAIVVLLGVVGVRVVSSRTTGSKRLAVAIGGGVASVTVSLFVAFALGFRPDFLFRGTFGDRIPVFGAAVEMARAEPVFGNGAGGFARLADAYLDVYSGVTPRLVWGHAHNTYLQTLLEFGLVGAGFIAIAFALVGRSLWKRRGRLSVPELGLFAALAVLALHGLTDHVLNGHGLTVLGGLALGGVLVGSGATSNPRRMLWERLFAIAVVLVYPVVVLWTVDATVAYEEGHSAAWDGDWLAAKAAFERAADADSLPLYERLARLAAIEGDGVDDPIRVPLEELVVPLNGPFVLGELRLLGRQDPVEGHATLDAVVGAFWHDEVALVEIGLQYESLGQIGKAEAAWDRALEIDPGLASAPLWNSTEERNALIDGVVKDLVDRQACSVSPELLLSSRTGSEAVERVAAECATSVSRWAAMYRLGRIAEVAGELDVRLAAVSDDARARRFAGLAAFESGNLTEARQHWARAARLQDLDAAVLLLGSYEEPPPRAVVDAAWRTVRRRSPVFQGPPAIYVLGSARLARVDFRPGVPSPLPSGEWELAVPATDARLEELLRSFD